MSEPDDSPLSAAEKPGEYLLRAAEAAASADRMGDARELYSKALAAAADADSRVDALAGLGHVAYRSGRPGEAIRFFEQAVEALDGRVWERPALAETLGRAHADTGDLDLAKDVFDACRRHFRATGDRIDEIRFACLAGYALTDSGRFEEAEAALAEVLDTGRDVEDPLTRGRLAWAQARLRAEQGQVEAAIAHAYDALDLLEEAGQGQSLASTYHLLAFLHNDLGRHDEAMTFLRKGSPLLMSDATPLQVAHYRIEEARAFAGLGEHEGAAALAMRVVAQLNGTRPNDAGRAYVLLGEIFESLGETAKARELYEVGITLLEGQGASRYLAEAYQRLGKLFEAEYRTRDALSVLRRALAVRARVEGAASRAPAA